jgi:hypothetical protein
MSRIWFSALFTDSHQHITLRHALSEPTLMVRVLGSVEKRPSYDGGSKATHLSGSFTISRAFLCRNHDSHCVALDLIFHHLAGR